MNRAAAWSIGIAVSGVIHLGAGAVLLHAVQPKPVEDQSQATSRLNVDAYEVEKADAVAQEPDTDKANEGQSETTKLGGNEIPQSSADAQSVTSNVARAQSPDLQALSAANVAAQALQDTAATEEASLAPSIPETLSAAVSRPEITNTSAALLVPSNVLEGATVATASLSAQPLPTAASQAIPAPAQERLDVSQLQPAVVPNASLSATSLAALASVPVSAALSAVPTTTVAQPAALQRDTAAPQVPPSQSTAAQSPDVTTTKAVLAFPGDSSAVDPVSLAAFQSFTQPNQVQGKGVRNSLSTLLSSVPCARMQVIFDPATTTLLLTGHVPDQVHKSPVLAALRDQMGTDITVADNLLILPEPQCGALTGIADVGLPQSTDQITNPLIVGSDTHARAFRYTAGQQLVLEMTGADYPSFVYVDYFDADGNVIHLSPNETVPLTLTPEKTTVKIGARTPNEPGLFITIGPPFGQEIAAAFASSVPLYEGTRPLIEPAEPYLAFLKEQVAQARQEHEDFKGEWVYFFVTTAAE